jgi:hypothetical protein
VPKRCIDCQHYSADSAGDRCPACGGPLATTLLPPLGTPTVPAADDPEPPPLGVVVAAWRRPRQGGSWVEWLTASRIGLSLLILGGVLVGGRFMDWAATKETGDADSTGRIRVGMAMSDIARVIESDKPYFPDLPHLTHDFPPGCRSTGILTWREKGRVVFIHFVEGRVTGVRDEPAGPHMVGIAIRSIDIDYD